VLGNGPQHPNVHVRLCREDDILKIQAILQLSPEAAPWDLASIRGIFMAHLKYFLIAERNKEVVGFICGRRMLDEAEILNLAVDPQARRLGVAHALLQALLESYAHENVLKVFLEVRESNKTAIEFYAKSDFLVTGKRPRYYRNPEEAALTLTLAVGCKEAR
jgi:[ribosomal protein S18]-alanine N-acetyltransferase